MAYRFKNDRPVAAEVRRIADRQLERAIVELSSQSGDAVVHEARRRIKKVRALIRLVEPRLRRLRRDNDRLRAASHLLAAMADSGAVIETVTRATGLYPGALTPRLRDLLRRALVSRAARISMDLRTGKVLLAAAHLLATERRRVRDWRIKGRGRTRIERGLRRGARRARQALQRTTDHPTIAHYHSWRRRVKDQWFHVRLLEGPCGPALAATRIALKELDGLLGEYHNCALLEQVVVSSEIALARDDAADVLRLLRRYRRALQDDARRIAEGLYSEQPRRFVQRITRAWHQPVLTGARSEASQWQPAA